MVSEYQSHYSPRSNFTVTVDVFDTWQTKLQQDEIYGI